MTIYLESLIVVGVCFEDSLKTCDGLVILAAEKVHLPQSKLRQAERGRQLDCLDVVVEGVIIVILSVVRLGEDETTLGLDDLNLGQVVGVLCQIFDLVIGLLVEKVVCQLVQDERMRLVNVVSISERLFFFLKKKKISPVNKKNK